MYPTSGIGASNALPSVKATTRTAAESSGAEAGKQTAIALSDTLKTGATAVKAAPGPIDALDAMLKMDAMPKGDAEKTKWLTSGYEKLHSGSQFQYQLPAECADEAGQRLSSLSRKLKQADPESKVRDAFVAEKLERPVAILDRVTKFQAAPAHEAEKEIWLSSAQNLKTDIDGARMAISDLRSTFPSADYGIVDAAEVDATVFELSFAVAKEQAAKAKR